MNPSADVPVPMTCHAHTADGVCGRWRLDGQPWCERHEPDDRRRLRDDRADLDDRYAHHLGRTP